MTIEDIPANDRVERFAAAGGQTVFSYDFPIYAAADLRVTRLRGGLESVLLNGADYTVAGVGEQAGGTITLTAAALAGDVLAIESAMPAGRSAAWETGGELPEDSLETEFNRLMVQQQQQNALIARGFRVPVTDAALNQLPPAAQRANRYLAFGPTGQPVAAALTTTSVPLVAGWLDIKAAGYIKADGATDDTAGWRAAAATGLPLYYSGGNSIITGQIDFTAAGQVVFGHDEISIITAVGNFDTFRFSGNVLGQGIQSIRFSSDGKTGGYDINLNGALRFHYQGCRHYNTWSAIYIGPAQGSEIVDCYVSAYRGERGILCYGTDAARCSILRIQMYRCAASASGVGGPGLEINGNCSTISILNFEGVGALMNYGVHIHNAAGGSLRPRFIFAHNIQAEFCGTNAIRIDSAFIVDIQSAYGSISGGTGLYIGDDAERISVDGGKFGGNDEHGAYIAGNDVSLSNCEFGNNSIRAPERGIYDGVHIAGTASGVTLTGGVSGIVGGAGATQRWGVYAASGAANITVCGMKLVGNLRGPARDDTGGAAGNMDVIGCAGLQSSFEANVTIGAQAGYRAVLTPTITAGAISAVAVTSGGFHYDAVPAVFAYDPAGTGSGATFTAVIANGKISSVTINTPGSNYGANTFLYVVPANSSAAVRALNSAVVSATLLLQAQGAGAVQLGSENGTGFDVTAAASAVNNLRATGSAAGSEVVLSAQGADTNIDLAILPKGAGLLRLGGSTAGSAGAVAAYLQVKVGGTTYKVPLHSV